MVGLENVTQLVNTSREFVQCDYCGKKEYDLEGGAIQGPLVYGWCRLQVKIGNRLYTFSDMCDECVKQKQIVQE